MPTKKNIFFTLLVGVIIISYVTLTSGVPLFCIDNDIPCMQNIDHFADIFFIFLPALLFSLITYPLHERVFRVWRNFALVWVPLTIFLVVITPDTSGSIVAFGKETVAMILSIVFSALSITIICVTWAIEHFKKRRK